MLKWSKSQQLCCRSQADRALMEDIIMLSIWVREISTADYIYTVFWSQDFRPYKYTTGCRTCFKSIALKLELKNKDKGWQNYWIIKKYWWQRWTNLDLWMTEKMRTLRSGNLTAPFRQIWLLSVLCFLTNDPRSLFSSECHIITEMLQMLWILISDERWLYNNQD